MITTESLTVDGADPAFVHLHHVQLRDSGVDMGGHLWLERAHLTWLIDQLAACLGAYGFPGAEATLGDDQLRVFESGPEQAPFVNVHCRRPKGGVHGGMMALVLTRPIAEQLLRDLRAL